METALSEPTGRPNAIPPPTKLHPVHSADRFIAELRYRRLPAAARLCILIGDPESRALVDTIRAAIGHGNSNVWK